MFRFFENSDFETLPKFWTLFEDPPDPPQNAFFRKISFRVPQPVQKAQSHAKLVVFRLKIYNGEKFYKSVGKFAPPPERNRVKTRFAK